MANIIDLIRGRHNLTPEIIRKYLSVFNSHLHSVLKEGTKTSYDVFKTRKCAVIKVTLSQDGEEGIRILQNQDENSLFSELSIVNYKGCLNNDVVNVIIADKNLIIIIKDFSEKVWNIGCARNDVVTIVNGGF